MLGPDKVKERRSLVIPIEVSTPKGWKLAKALVNSGAELNFISQLWAKEAELEEAEPVPTAAQTLDGKWLTVYGNHYCRSRTMDSKGNALEGQDDYCAVDFSEYDVILRYLWLQIRNPDINWRQGT
jgi:hypothetical protein